MTTDYPALLIRLTVGLIFLSEGIQKWLFPDTLGSGRFEKLGIHPAGFWAPFTSCFEILCGLLVIVGFLTRLAVLPLLVVMIVAFITTKWPEWIDQGFWIMAHDGRTDLAMTLLLIFLLIYGAGRFSLDHTLYAKRKK